MIGFTGKIKQAMQLTKMLAVVGKYKSVSAARRLTTPSQSADPQADLLRRAFVELGTSYIKLGQWLSVRPDFVSPEIIKELEKLQDRLPPLPFSVIQSVIEAETGKPLSDLFASIDPKPISTASIGQVHWAVLKTGESVAVKVQRPNLLPKIKVELDNLKLLVRWAVKRWPEQSAHRWEEVVDEFKQSLFSELDFTQEARNQDRMRQLTKDFEWIKIAKVCWEYTTPRLLVMEYLKGFKVTDHKKLQASDLDPHLLAQRLCQISFFQIFEAQFFQSDPHPGNVILMEDNVLGLIDFGIVEKLDRNGLDLFADWFYAGIMKDVDMLVNTIVELSHPNVNFNRSRLKTDCMDLMEEIAYRPVGSISFQKSFEILGRILYKHQISMPPIMVSLFKTVSTLEGTITHLDKGYDWREDWGPRLEEIVEQRMKPERLSKEYLKSFRGYNKIFNEFQHDLPAIIDRFKEGRIEVHLPDLKNQIHSVERSSEKISVALVLSSVILGLFYIGQGQGYGFLSDLLDHFFEYWGVLLLLIPFWHYYRVRT